MNRTMFVLAVLACGIASADSADGDRQAADEAAIRKAVVSYVTAFNEGNAKLLAELWSPEAVYTNPISGEQVVGREQIQQQFSAIFEQSKGSKLEATTESIGFVSPNVAIERGKAKVVRADESPEETEYTAVYVKRDGQWLLDRVTEEDVETVPSHYEHLKPLEWMIGTWVDEDDESRIETTCQWTKNQNFMTRSFTIAVHDRIEMSGMQIVGWDPTAKRIRSWVFDSDGGFGEGTWTKKGNAWHIQVTATTPDGKQASSTNIITYINDQKFTWQSINREVGGELLPNVDEVVVARQLAGE